MDRLIYLAKISVNKEKRLSRPPFV